MNNKRVLISFVNLFVFSAILWELPKSSTLITELTAGDMMSVAFYVGFMLMAWFGVTERGN